MPGIVGLISKLPRGQAQQELLKMMSVMCHEDFYVTGTVMDESLGVYAGWTVRRGSFAGEMPVGNESGDAVLIFSGEEFPEPGTSERLRKSGHQIEPGECPYLVHWYEEDPSFPANLNGRFHGLLLDRRQGTAALFNDRYGMHRVYCHQAKDAFYFAGEAKAILAVRPELRSADPQGLGEYIACGAVLENRTLFPGIALLPPASRWTFRDGALEKKEIYFDPSEWENQAPLEPEFFHKQLSEVFSRNLPRYFEGRQRVGMSLTGGLDTRMILAWQKAEPGAMPCYTFGSMFRENQDVRVARRVAEACKQPFQVLAVGDEFLSRFSHYAERAVYLTDGCVDVSRAPDLYLNERAREIAPVRMTGNYGGEILRRVRAFKPEYPSEGFYQPEMGGYIRQAGETYGRMAHGHPVTFAAFRQSPWYHYGILALEQTQLSMRSPFLDNDFVRMVYRAPASELASNQASLWLIADGNPALLRIPTDRGLAGQQGHLWAAASRALLEFQFKAEYAYDMGMPQWVAQVDHAFSAFHLERLFLGKHKVFHFRVWYRDALAGYVGEMLLDQKSLKRPYLEGKRVEEMVQRHLKGDRNYTNEIHKLLTLEILHRLFLDNPAAGKWKEQPEAAVSARGVH